MDSCVVPLAVVLEHACVSIENHIFCFLEVNIQNLVVAVLSVSGHDDLVGEFGLEKSALLLSIFAIMSLVEVVDEVEDGFVADHFLG